MANGHITIDVRCGPALAATMEAIDLIEAALELIPEWHKQERDELQAKCEELCGICRSPVMRETYRNK